MQLKINERLNSLFIGKRGEIIRYLIIGGLTTAVSFLIYTAMFKLFSIDVNLSNVTSVAMAIIFAYVLNKLFVFKSHCVDLKELSMEFVKFISSRLFTLALEIGGVLLLVNIIGQDELLGKAETQIIVIIGNYITSKFFVFTHKKEESKDEVIS